MSSMAENVRRINKVIKRIESGDMAKINGSLQPLLDIRMTKELMAKTKIDKALLKLRKANKFVVSIDLIMDEWRKNIDECEMKKNDDKIAKMAPGQKLVPGPNKPKKTTARKSRSAPNLCKVIKKSDACVKVRNGTDSGPRKTRQGAMVRVKSPQETVQPVKKGEDDALSQTSLTGAEELSMITIERLGQRIKDRFEVIDSLHVISRLELTSRVIVLTGIKEIVYDLVNSRFKKPAEKLFTRLLQIQLGQEFEESDSVYTWQEYGECDYDYYPSERYSEERENKDLSLNDLSDCFVDSPSSSSTSSYF